MERSKALLDSNDLITAEHYGDSALTEAIMTNSLDSQMTAHLFLYEVHSRMKDYQKAIGDFRMAAVYRDSIRSLERNSEVGVLKTALTAEKDSAQQKITLLNSEIARLRDSADRDRFNMLPIIGGLLILMGLAVFMIYRDRTRLKTSLKQSEEDLHQLRAFKDKLFTILSYDLRTSLSSFENLSHGLSVQMDTLDKEESIQFLNKLNETAGDLKATLSNVIHWVALQANSKPFMPVNFDCKILAGQVLERFKVQLTDRNLIADVFIPDGQDVHADREMVEIILENLVSNAIHFTPQGGAITCFSGKKDGLVTIGVKDTGVGITKEDVEKLFRPEADVHSIGKPSHKGAGVGLILSKELVERNGGRMYVESTAGEGSTFYFTLPEKKFA